MFCQLLHVLPKFYNSIRVKCYLKWKVKVVGERLILFVMAATGIIYGSLVSKLGHLYNELPSYAPASVAQSDVIQLGPVVQSVVSLTSSLRAISLTILADSIYNFLKFFAAKM